ncbi:MAG: bifunctional folylpolyglutamate synthase/dihydrofolate synthase [Firmicutes bacterium]|nr:bifunctional folylpolyglutamate synthase/dihydrofolate synthase [Bacillota bacterium]
MPQRNMNAVERIHNFEKFGIVLGMERMEELLTRLGNPHKGQKYIHVAGTNGKGSVCKYLEMGLSGCGYKVGVYTSPYIERFNERIRYDGEDISDEDLESTAWRVIKAAESMTSDGLDSPTEFEVVTAIAFLYYKEKSPDYVILEVGMGGTGDSTNIIEAPLASIITSISFDHMGVLGDTLAEIAGNKAGIIKADCPVISNVPEHEAAKVIARTAYEKGARLYDVSRIPVAVTDESAEGETVSMELFGKSYSGVRIPMTGSHQAQNLKTALAALEILRASGKVSLYKDGLYEGLSRARQNGRFEVLSRGGEGKPAIVIDGAHNEAGASSLEATMKECYPGKRVLLVTGILADKDVDAILEHFAGIAECAIATEPDNPRKLTAGELAERLEKHGVSAEYESDIEKAIELANQKGNEYDVIFYAGSLYLVGKVRGLVV